MESLSQQEIEGAWKGLCAGVMMQAVERLCGVKLYRPSASYKSDGKGGLYKETLRQKTQARNWLDGGVGEVTFEDCCDSLKVDPDRARRLIVKHAARHESQGDARARP